MYSAVTLPLLSTGLSDTKLLAIGIGAGLLVGAIVALALVIFTGDSE